ncbi:MAG: hypothetical protein IRY99_13630, partial [Isosphaeraceae bacterium]|nr:hypothetical protein [Isosphaeraceae bacterium]
LLVGTGGNYLGELSWAGSSGGYSRYETEPGYQQSVQTTGRRSTPDVAFDGDPSSGVMVYATAPSTGLGSWQQVGGTSLGAPAWAGIIAIVDQGRAAAGLGSLDGASQTLPALYSLPSSDFHAVAGPFFFGSRFGFGLGGSTATAGRGTPNGASLVNDLAFGVGATSGGTTASTQATSQNIVGISPPILGGSGGQSRVRHNHGPSRGLSRGRPSNHSLALAGSTTAGRAILDALIAYPPGPRRLRRGPA